MAEALETTRQKEIWEGKVEAIKEKYEARIITILNAIAEACERDGLYPGLPYDMFNGSGMGTYTWWLIVNRDVAGVESGENDNSADVSFNILESTYHGYEFQGINFSVDIVDNGGAILGGACPGNYSDDLWVPIDDAAAIEERFKILERMDTDSVPGLIGKVKGGR